MKLGSRDVTNFKLATVPSASPNQIRIQRLPVAMTTLERYSTLDRPV